MFTASHRCLSQRFSQLVASRNCMVAFFSIQVIVLIIFLYVFNDTIRTIRMPVLKGIQGDNHFHVPRYNVFNDILELIGYNNPNFGRTSNTSSRHEKEVRVWQNKTLLRQVKPAISQDEDLQRERLPFERFFKIHRQSKEISCSKLFNGDKREHERAKHIMENTPETQYISPEEYISLTSNCSTFKHDRGYITKPLTKEEEQFPIAFSIIMYKDVWQFERLLRAIYRPQNHICIHVDRKTKNVIFKAVSGISHCLDNVFIASKRIRVIWSTFTALEPDIVCMRDLWNRSKTWKYFINLTGQEFPLRTNHELVKILKLYNGTNAIDGSYKGARMGRIWKTGPPPYGLKFLKGSVHIAASRAFVGFVVNDQKAAAVLNWTRRTWVPDEHFFQIMNFNPSLNVSGSYKGVPEILTANRFKVWGKRNPCGGKVVRGVCIFGTGDLPRLAQRKEMFANKFYQRYQRLALDCMEELLFNRTLDQYFGKDVFDLRWYSKLAHVKNKLAL